ncbi:MAG: pentapeptide repeat-containing protein [Bauldia sp.]|nr:pentapeptide repeat-containing protein [Bauldia sp.]
MPRGVPNSGVLGRALRRATAVATSVLAIAAASGALAQDSASGRSTIRDVVIGAPLSEQPPDFQEFACGTNGGPASLLINSLADFGLCPAEPTGLHEVQFRYNDELHYVALAQRDPLRAELFQGTRIGNFPIIASMLIDDAGIVRGVRGVTDDRVSDRTRRMAYSMGDFVRTVYGSQGWDCTDLPRAEGESEVGNSFIKEDCSRVQDGFLMTTRTRLFRRPGQSLIDPVNGQVRVGYYESTARIEIYQVDEAGDPIYGGDPGETVEPEDDEPAVAPDDPVEAFLQGFTNDCPGCDLSGARLVRRSLAGADLSGADLSGASLHRALLGGANLSGANLTNANLNLADLKRASLVDADLNGAMLYQTDAALADFTGATLNRTATERARFTNAVMVGVEWQTSYGLNLNAAGANLTGADLTGSFFVETDFQRATLAGANVTEVAFYRARLLGANLTGATAVRADFLEADLSTAVFAEADLTEARLLRARSSGLDLTGATMNNTIMPNGNVAD